MAGSGTEVTVNCPVGGALPTEELLDDVPLELLLLELSALPDELLPDDPSLDTLLAEDPADSEDELDSDDAGGCWSLGALLPLRLLLGASGPGAEGCDISASGGEGESGSIGAIAWQSVAGPGHAG